MNYRESGRLMRERMENFPNDNHRRVDEQRKCPVLIFAGEIAAHPGVRAQYRPMSLSPTVGDVIEHRQDRNLIIVVPENERIAPEKNQAEENHETPGGNRAKE